MLLTQAIRRNATSYAESVATSEGDLERTWSQVADRIARAATAIRSMGVQPGDRVGILALNSARYLEAQFAIWWAGAVIVPMNTRWSLGENLYSARDAGIVLLMFDDSFNEIATAIADDLSVNLVYLGECPPEGAADYEQLVAHASPEAAHDAPYDGIAGIYYTGGTTGKPKGVVLSHLALWSSSMSSAQHMRLDSTSRYLHAAPMFHLADGGFGLSVTFVGAAHEFMPRFDVTQFIETVEAKNITHAVLVPTMIGMIQESTAYAPERLRSLQRLAFGASPMPEPILVRMQADLPNVELVHAYGQTEMAPMVTVLEPRFQRAGDRRAMSVGKPASSLEIRIVDKDGAEVAANVPGEILARGLNMMSGYWNQPEQTAAAMKGGWVHTGDVGYRDEEGFLYICDRAKDMIISGGENIFSAEVEDAIASHPAIAQVAVVAAPDDAYGERVHAVLVFKPGEALSLEAVKTHCAQRIAGYKHRNGSCIITTRARPTKSPSTRHISPWSPCSKSSKP